MRRILLAFVSFAVSGCASTDDPALFIDVDYQVRCLEPCMSAADDVKHQFATLDDDQGFQVECYATTVGKDRVLSFSAQHDVEGTNMDYGIEVLQAAFQGDDPGSKCLVRVKEKSNRYVGKCTGGDPEPDAPCQVEIDIKDGIVTGTLFCVQFPNEGNEMSTRHLVLSDRFGTTHDDLTPATFEIHGCKDL
jgi:hypothetical protein